MSKSLEKHNGGMYLLCILLVSLVEKTHEALCFNFVTTASDTFFFLKTILISSEYFIQLKSAWLVCRRQWSLQFTHGLPLTFFEF